MFGNSAELDCSGVCAEWRQKARPDPGDPQLAQIPCNHQNCYREKYSNHQGKIININIDDRDGAQN